MFKAGERVFDISKGWGTVYSITTRCVEVEFEKLNSIYDYTHDGFYEGGDMQGRSLYHHDYTPIEGEAIIGTKIENTAFLSRSNELTKREHFAGMAMQGILAGREREFVDDYKNLADVAVNVADALIKALNEK
jgi:hypothetical protein